MRKRISILMVSLLAVCICGCGGKDGNKLLDPKNPVSLTIWHYYNGAQQGAFDRLVEEFNETEGKKQGIIVQAYSQGTVGELEENIRASMRGEVGAKEMPDIFSSYADTAYEAEQSGILADLSRYFTEEELDEYVDSYIEEGNIGQDGGLRIFPVAKSTEIMMLNKTDWDKFAGETGTSLDELSTMEGVARAAQAYYQWTDDKTPDVPGDGKALYGRDSMANYFCIGMRQMGKEIFQVEDGKVTFNIEKEDMYRLWENYYIPYIKGYYGAFGKFRSDDVKTGDLIAFTGSTTSSMYFPDWVEDDEESYPIEYEVLPAPVLEGCDNWKVQQGAGMVITKSSEAREYAASVFMKWFTQTENSLAFGCSSGYLPVKNDAHSVEILDRVIAEKNLEVPEKTYDCLVKLMESQDEEKLYTTKAFKNGYAARNVLEYHLSDKAAADREKILPLILKGESPEEAAADYVTQEAFEQWYEEFSQALENAI